MVIIIKKLNDMRSTKIFIGFYGKLSGAAVNSILANLVQIAPAIKGRSIQLQMNPPSPPTGQGITDKNTLMANGNNVTTD
jgi:hypothetical protein